MYQKSTLVPSAPEPTEESLEGFWEQMYKKVYHTFKNSYKYVESGECKINSLPQINLWVFEKEIF